MSSPAKILVVEDHAELAGLLSMHLSDAGFAVDWHEDGKLGFAEAETGRFDMVILDLMLPGIGGFEFCRRLRQQNNGTPILMLTSRSSEFDRVHGLETGADDYLTKPFSFRELIARVKAILRRLERAGQVPITHCESINLGRIQINVCERSILVEGRSIDLTAREFDLLAYFAGHPGRVFTRRELLDAVWGDSYEGYEHTVNSHINRLRSKIEADQRNPEYIETVWGVGYRMKKPKAEPQCSSAD